MGVMGAEVEYIPAFVGVVDKAQKTRLTISTVGSVGKVVKAVRAIEGPTSPQGWMIENGARIYQDAHFVEIATPEVTNPLEALIYQRACEVIVLEALRAATSALKLRPDCARLVRRSSDDVGHYVGFHTSVQTLNFGTPLLVEHLAPLLVTRFYACAGSIGPDGFTMSNKHPAVKTVASTDSRENRGIIHLKDEPLAGLGSKRIHITHGDACMADLSNFLAIGTTALVIHMLDDGVCVGPAYKLEDPVAALRHLDGDPTCTGSLQLTSGATATPLDIQEHYLRAAEKYAAKKNEHWMGDVAKRWRWVVDRLREQGPVGLSACLDPYIKLRLYSERLRHHGLDWAEFSPWCAPVELTRGLLGSAPKGYAPGDAKGHLRERMPSVSFGFLSDRMARARLDWSDLRRAVGLYEELLALDFKYHEICSTGLYYRLRDAGVVDSALFSEQQVQQVIREPPSDTRAWPRGRAVREVVAEVGAAANWLEVRSSKRRMRLPDPTSTTGTWEPVAAKKR